MPGPAERALARHRADLLEVLIEMFELPIPKSDLMGRKVVTRILG